MEKIQIKKELPGDSIIKLQVVKASEEAFPFEVWDKYLNTGEMGSDEKTFDEKIEKATVECKDLHDYRVALETILKNKPEFVDDILSHENAHSNKSEQLGYGHKSYKFVILRDSTGELIIHPSFLPEKEILDKEDRKKIAKAPEEYDSYLSDMDKKEI